jgi:ribosome-associated protein
MGAKAPAPALAAEIKPNTAAEALKVVLHSLEDAKAEDTVPIDLTDKSPIADFMIVASGRSHRHVAAIADRLLADLKLAGFADVRVEGLPNCDWVLVDAGDVIAHVFRPEVRSFYNLERLWQAAQPDGPVLMASRAS